MSRLLTVGAAIITAFLGYAAGRTEASLRGPGDGTTYTQEGVSQRTQPASVYLPMWVQEGTPDLDGVAPVEVLAAVGPGGILPIPTTIPTTWPDVLSEAELRAVLTAAGWPAELHDAAMRVARCESSWSPGAIGDHGASLGLFQVNLKTWFPYAGEDPEQWADPIVNARVALAAYRYSDGWRQWSCRP